MILNSQVLASYIFWDRTEGVEFADDMMCITAAASDAKLLLERAAKANVSGPQREVEHLLADGRALNDFKQKLQRTCRDGLGHEALALAAEARASAMDLAIGEG